MTTEIMTSDGDSAGHRAREKRGVIYLLIAVAGMGAMPLIVALSGVTADDGDGAALAGSWAFGASIVSSLLFLWTAIVGSLSNPMRPDLYASMSRLPKKLAIMLWRLAINILKLILSTVLAFYGILIFAAIVQLGVDILVSAIIFESVTILLLVYNRRLVSRVTGFWRRIRGTQLESSISHQTPIYRSRTSETILTIAGFFMLICALYFVAASISAAEFASFSDLNVETLLGFSGGLQWTYNVVLLIFLGVVFLIAALFFIPLFWQLKLFDGQSQSVSVDSTQSQRMNPYFLAAISICLLITAWFYNLAGETLSVDEIPRQVHAFGVLGGMTTSIGILSWHRGRALIPPSFESDRSDILFLSWLRPVIAFILLLVFLLLGAIETIVRIDFILFGATGILIFNLLRNFASTHGLSLGARATVVALWFSGVIVYGRDDLFEFMNIRGWLWPNSVHFELLALAATIFTLLLAFRIARLVGRTNDEDNRTFALSRKLDRLIQRDIVSKDVDRLIRDIDVLEQQPDELKSAYDKTMTLLDAAYEKIPNTEKGDKLKDEISEAVSDLNSLVHSKTQGVLHGEFFAVSSFAFISAGIALLSRPQGVSEMSGFLTEMFAILFTAIITFLTFHLQDLQNKRIEPVLSSSEDIDAPFSRMQFHSQTRILEFSSNSLIPLIIPIIILVVWAFLLAVKWFEYWSLAEWFFSAL